MGREVRADPGRRGGSGDSGRFEQTGPVESDLTSGEIELLVAGLSDDVALVWVLICLGIRGNPPAHPGPPSASDVDAAFVALDRLSRAGLVSVGHSEYLDGGPPGRFAPVKHVQEPIGDVKARVVEACTNGADWEWFCWVVNTADGDERAQAQRSTRDHP